MAFYPMLMVPSVFFCSKGIWPNGICHDPIRSNVNGSIFIWSDGICYDGIWFNGNDIKIKVIR
jgi:hypothetical protein